MKEEGNNFPYTNTQNEKNKELTNESYNQTKLSPQVEHQRKRYCTNHTEKMWLSYIILFSGKRNFFTWTELIASLVFRGIDRTVREEHYVEVPILCTIVTISQ